MLFNNKVLKAKEALAIGATPETNGPTLALSVRWEVLQAVLWRSSELIGTLVIVS